ncbi:MAG: hypothetical protein WC609_01590 [Candidatus Paceibacterota bacterium]|jgi:hypothetical protein
MIKIFKEKKIKNGYATLELLFYIAFFIVLSLVVIDAMIVMAKSFKETAIQAELVQSGSIMERMSREIRGAYSIDGTSTSTDLKLTTKDGAGVTGTVEFSLVGTDLRFLENGTLVGNLNTPNIAITSISFTPITTARGKAVGILLGIKSNNDILNRVVDFNDTLVLRGSYQL